MLRRVAVPLCLVLAFAAGSLVSQLPSFSLTAQAGSRYFPETHHYIKGLFLQYWADHGGLAQQGYPLTEEFTEASKQDPGKSYTVQYFERTVFERHPENAGTPYEVLLTQLGTYELASRYPHNSNPAAAPVNGPPPPPTVAPPPPGGQQFSGTSDQPTAPFSLHKGLVVFHSVCASCAGNFAVQLLDNTAKLVALATNVIGGGDWSAAAGVPADGSYSLQVSGDAAWTVTVSQPTAPYHAPPATQQWQGHGHQATPLFSLKAGAAHFHAVATHGSGNFGVQLLHADGSFVELLANKIGPADVSIAVNIPQDGVYIINTDYDADWVISVQQ